MEIKSSRNKKLNKKPLKKGKLFSQISG